VSSTNTILNLIDTVNPNVYDNYDIYSTFSALPNPAPTSTRFYFTSDTQTYYRWNGSAYVVAIDPTSGTVVAVTSADVQTLTSTGTTNVVLTPKTNQANGLVKLTAANTLPNSYLYFYSNMYYVDPVNGSNSNTGAYGAPFKTITYTLSVAPSGSSIILANGTYSENVTVSTANLDILSLAGNNSALVQLTGTWAFSHSSGSVRCKYISFYGNTTHTGSGLIYFTSCNFGSASYTDSATGYIEVLNSDWSSCTSINLTGAHIYLFFGSQLNNVIINNSSAIVNCQSSVDILTLITVTAGTLLIRESICYSAGPTANALIASSGAVIDAIDSNFVTPTNSIARISLASGSYYSFTNVTYDKANSTLSTNVGTVAHFDALALDGTIPVITTATMALVADTNGQIKQQALLQGATGMVGASGPVGPVGATGPSSVGLTGATGLQGGSSSYFKYQFDTVTSSHPASGFIRYDNVTPSLVSNVYVNVTTSDSLDIFIFLSYLNTGDQFAVQDASSSSNYDVWILTSAPVLSGSYMQLPVSYVSSGGTPFILNQNILLILLSVGPQGQSGIQGYSGNTGIQGLVGNTGIQGLVGNTGIQGLSGNTGIQGISGNTGIQGLIGNTGIQGYSGNTGIQGYSGNTGIQGLIGNTGIQGLSGNTGIQGLIGNTGIQGLIGNTGIQGYSGNTGIQGVGGNTGIQGLVGNTGILGSATSNNTNLLTATLTGSSLTLGPLIGVWEPIILTMTSPTTNGSQTAFNSGTISLVTQIELGWQPVNRGLQYIEYILRYYDYITYALSTQTCYLRLVNTTSNTDYATYTISALAGTSSWSYLYTVAIIPSLTTTTSTWTTGTNLYVFLDFSPLPQSLTTTSNVTFNTESLATSGTVTGSSGFFRVSGANSYFDANGTNSNFKMSGTGSALINSGQNGNYGRNSIDECHPFCWNNTQNANNNLSYSGYLVNFSFVSSGSQDLLTLLPVYMTGMRLMPQSPIRLNLSSSFTGEYFAVQINNVDSIGGFWFGLASTAYIYQNYGANVTATSNSAGLYNTTAAAGIYQTITVQFTTSGLTRNQGTAATFTPTSGTAYTGGNFNVGDIIIVRTLLASPPAIAVHAYSVSGSTMTLINEYTAVSLRSASLVGSDTLATYIPYITCSVASGNGNFLSQRWMQNNITTVSGGTFNPLQNLNFYY